MRSIVINIPTDTQRLEAFVESYPSNLLPKLEVWKAKIGADVEVPDWWEHSANRWALTQNFIDILNACDEDVWIWEDDCIFASDFQERFPAFMKEVPADADMVFLGGHHFGYPIRISELAIKLKATWCGHAILYKHRCVKAFAESLSEPNWECSHYSDQKRAQDICSGKMIAYCPLHTLCGQAEGFSNLDNHVRGKRWYNTFKFVDLDGKIKQMKNGTILQPRQTP